MPGNKANAVAKSKNAVQKRSLMDRLKKDIKLNYLIYLMLIPGIIILIMFKLGPMGGMVIAFQDFSAFKGIFSSDWVWFDNFIRIFQDKYMLTLIGNTLTLAFLTIAVTFPIPIIFTLFLNEVRVSIVRKGVQSLSFLPYFISSAVMVSIMYTLTSPSYGLINVIIKFFGGDPIYFMTEVGWFRPIYLILKVWGSFGYSSIIYLASIIAIDPTLYEAAEVDGASRWQKMFRITLPQISGSIIIMLIIKVGGIFTVDLDTILLMYNPSVYKVADVIQSYVYRIAFDTAGFPDYSYGTAVNLVKSVIAFGMVYLTNKVAKKYSDTRLF